jgi:hypothetical protein
MTRHHEELSLLPVLVPAAVAAVTAIVTWIKVRPRP